VGLIAAFFALLLVFELLLDGGIETGRSVFELLLNKGNMRHC
jgi:hypothetical protein